MDTNKPVVLFRSEVPSTKGRQFVASALLAISLGVVSLQAGFVLNASAQNNPITSAITSAIVCPEGHNLTNVNGAAVCVSQTNTNQNQQNNNQNNNQNNGSTSNSNTNNPATSPEVSSAPTATPAPLTAPEVNPTPVPSHNNSSDNNGGSNNSGGGAPSCNNEAPKAPRIISAVTSGKNEITLNWEKPVSGNVSHYSISYGLLKGKPLYGIANAGNVTSFKVAGLAGGVTYYFTVKAVNTCTPSVASNEVAIKVGGKFINTPAVGFSSNAVLGKTNQTVKFNNSASKPVVSKPVVFNNEVVNQSKPSAGLVGKVVGFFKGLF